MQPIFQTSAKSSILNYSMWHAIIYQVVFSLQCHKTTLWYFLFIIRKTICCRTCLTLYTSEKNPEPILCIWKSSSLYSWDTAWRTATHDGVKISSGLPSPGQYPGVQGKGPLSRFSPRGGLNFCMVLIAFSHHNLNERLRSFTSID